MAQTAKIDGYHSALQKNVWGLSYMKCDYKVKVINYTLMFYRDGHIKGHLTLKYFFHLNKSLHQFETHCAFLN